LEAFDAIHARGVAHEDIRAENILVGKEDDNVWIIDFEFSRIVDNNSREEVFAAERKAVERMLTETHFKKG